MANKRGAVSRLREFSGRDPDFSQIEAIEREIFGESDRAVALTLGAMVEAALERLIRKHLRDDLTDAERKRIFADDRGPLSTFASKTIVAYAMRLLGPISRDDLDMVRAIRNAFAHSRRPLRFSDPEVNDVCQLLKMPALPETTIPQAYLNRAPNAQRDELSNSSHPKTRFVMTVHTLAYRMLVVRDGIKAGDFVFRDDQPLP